MGWGSGSAVGVLVINGERVTVVAVCDIDSDILGTHRARNDGQARRVACDGGRSDAVGCTIVEALGMGWGSGSAVGVLVINGERVAVDTVSYINRYVLVTHRARNDGQVRRVACDRRRGDAVGRTVVKVFGMGWCSDSTIFIFVVDGKGVAVDGVSDIDCHILGTHCARNDRLVRCVTSNGGRGDAVGCTVAEVFGMGWCSGSAVCVLVVDGEGVAVLAEVSHISSALGDV